ncbi:MAG TPA: hypothetical protein VFU55_13835 [Terracidiphilus sp.]|nr:hypothetical protein [Terracidiphilus sp.]
MPPASRPLQGPLQGPPPGPIPGPIPGHVSGPVQDEESSPPRLDHAHIREQLARLLTHPLFANSKRYPALLAYAVEQTLQGNAAELKERAIGAEVFGRSPDYDANADPVVRITAGEVRKRLSQYYYDDSHQGEIVLELPIGSYVPAFRMPRSAPEPAILLPEPVPAPVAPTQIIHRVHSLAWAGWVAGIIMIACATFGGFQLGRQYPATPPPTNIDLFWAPILSSANPATFCLGEPGKPIPQDAVNSYDAPIPDTKPEPLYFRLQYAGDLSLADVITLTRTAAALQIRHKAFRVEPASSATFAELREGPGVFIGAFDNIWTLRLTQKLRFGFESRNGVAMLVDRKSHNATAWQTAWDLPYQKLARDYAIVARLQDAVTGQPVIIAAGISEQGTEAAGEILYNPVYLQSLIAKAPADWEHKNLEAVIETQIIQGHSGPPEVLAVETW